MFRNTLNILLHLQQQTMYQGGPLLAEPVSVHAKKKNGSGYRSASPITSREFASALTSKLRTACSSNRSKTPASRRVSRARDGSQNLSQLRTIILSSFLDNSPCKASEYFEPRMLRFKRLSTGDSAPNVLVCLRFLSSSTFSTSTTSFTAWSFKSLGMTRP
jgi:hypothetical protein